MTENKDLCQGSSLAALDEDLWLRNRGVHLASKGAMRPWVCRDIKQPLLVLLPDARQARDFAADAEELGVLENVKILPEMILAEDDLKSEAQRIVRGDILENFRYKGGVLAATPASLMAPFSTGGDYMELECGREAGRSRLIDWLEQKGYERSDLVWTPGQFAVRGSIVDIFSPSDMYPVRVEFFDDEVESLRFFVPETQKSLRTIRKSSVQSLVSKSDNRLENYFPEDMRILFFDPHGLDTTAENAVWLWQSLDREDTVPWEAWEKLCAGFTAHRRLRILPDVKNCAARMAVMQFPNFRGKLKEVELYCLSMIKDGYRIKVVSEAERNLQWARINGFEACEGILSEGFIDSYSKCAVMTDLELSGITVARRRIENRAPSDWGAGLIPGQWVVHDEYGVAVYQGAEQVKTADGEQEYLILQFAEERRLLIPVMQFHKISPWSPLPGQEPTADNLKGSHWKRAASRAKQMAEQAAAELIKIYAEREVSKGFSFPDNREMMRELEESFTYKETIDQLRAIEDVERDMERPVPMDRLIVGDVGFGKTEVAIRAAGKAVFAGKQTAIMAPTTLLAQQHFETFTARFANTPIRVEVISRFVPVGQQKRILQDLSEGKVDILIGTHRILTDDVKFKDIGLIIVDEEHRFGVMHKDHLKKSMPGVDVLMLSATPIPRSLSLSISGLRDMSILQTPPQRRLPVITVVRPFSEELLKNAVLREKNRGGQIFFVHNRINDLQERAVMLKRLFPKLNIAVAHSKTSESALEKTMSEFAAGKIDILVCTTIVESGLDIPAANTLIVDDAHELGLAQMYQLRGRVGRREEQAYAFLFYPSNVHISVESSERLEAIAELDELGAGYQLAQRDLQIRGGGDLIGISQHGNSSKIGYQKYCDLLAEEISKIKGTYRPQMEMEIGFPVSIPGDYLPQENLRVTLYRRLLKTDSLEEVRELREETEDRFGRIPNELDFLFNVAAIKGASCDLGLTKMICSRYELVLQGNPDGAWERLKLPPKWRRRLDGFIGPGGFAGIKDIARIIQEQNPASI
ncbi:transcription-repair coupling factor [Cloacibacillus porcorum]|uniref:transcription-repair coupling factor n=1 Tax=Cloacibacillus porcorum TaxID=1197717 RepID=UPI0014596F87|nr:transcription-repair coupling factor [Cloacibacillus porcorum]MCC8185187.1 transcription-repair coupling factor [Cloacibacillus porcorum]MDY5390201.1 transcription-repair coupling factor [Cloacibacillus porcorum]NMF18770.1 transcription-repair coupling factor [Cloacibacillus porcorum]